MVDRSTQVHFAYAKEAYIAVTPPIRHLYHYHHWINAACIDSTIAGPRSSYISTLPNLEIKAKLKLEGGDER